MRRFAALVAAALVLGAAGACWAIGFDDLPDPRHPAKPAKPVPAAEPAKPPAKPTQPAVDPTPPAAGPADTYEQRDAVCHQNQKCAVESLRLPLVKCVDEAPPAKVLPDQWALPHLSTRQREFLWTIIPLKVDHGNFLERYEKAATDDERFALADWCKANGLPTCADFIYRTIIHAHWGDLQHPVYKRAMDAWRPGAAARPSAFVFDLPVRGPWYVEKDTAGRHRGIHGALFAVNLVIQDPKGRQYDGPADQIASYYAWGKPFFAIADGRIVKVEDQYDDPPLRRAGDWRVANAIYQDCGGGVYAFYAHIRKGSAKVKEGDVVERGQELGLVGNSGGNGVPHLHFIILDGDYFSIPGRFRFEQMTPRRWVARDGATLAEDTYIRPVSAPAKAPAKRPTGPRRPTTRELSWP